MRTIILTAYVLVAVASWHSFYISFLIFVENGKEQRWGEIARGNGSHAKYDYDGSSQRYATRMLRIGTADRVGAAVLTATWALLWPACHAIRLTYRLIRRSHDRSGFFLTPKEREQRTAERLAAAERDLDAAYAKLAEAEQPGVIFVPSDIPQEEIDKLHQRLQQRKGDH